MLLTSLLEAADRVDSTTGLQMAYLKEWAPRAYQPLALRVPALLDGPGRAVQGDARDLAGSSQLGDVDLAYLDPPYNQHRYDSNYHVWETIVAWDAAHYGVACKREDLRDPRRRSAFNGRRSILPALGQVIDAVRAEVVVLSYNNEAWLTFEELHALCSARGSVRVLVFDSACVCGSPDRGFTVLRAEGRGGVPPANTEYVRWRGNGAGVRRMVDVVVGAGWVSPWTSPCRSR